MHLNRQKINKIKITPSSNSNIIKKKNKPHIKKIEDKTKKENNPVSVIKSPDIFKRSKAYTVYKPLEEWTGLLKGYPAFVLGNSPSLSNYNIKLLDSYFTIGINRIFYVFDPTIHIWQDRKIWRDHNGDILKQKSIKLSKESSDPEKLFINFKHQGGDFKIIPNSYYLCGIGNTGALAAQLAINLGCSSLVLLGMDCKYSDKGDTDFYGKNKDHKTYTLRFCNKGMEWLKKSCPVPIYSCGDSPLWPKIGLEDVIEKISPEKKDREFFDNIFRKKTN